jgi:hypothetical protein
MKTFKQFIEQISTPIGLVMGMEEQTDTIVITRNFDYR